MLQERFTMVTGDEVFDMCKPCTLQDEFNDESRKGKGTRDARSRKE